MDNNIYNSLLFPALTMMEHYSMENAGGHLLPKGTEARQLNNPAWRDPALNMPNIGKDYLGLNSKNRSESLRNAMAKSLLFSLIPDKYKIVKDSLMKTQAFNAEARLNKDKVPTSLLLSVDF